MLVAQANTEMLTIATVDSALGAYPVRSVSPRE
jgi:PIN domain nuclease of toxin-antitoxin system